MVVRWGYGLMWRIRASSRVPACSSARQYAPINSAPATVWSQRNFSFQHAGVVREHEHLPSVIQIDQMASALYVTSHRDDHVGGQYVTDDDGLTLLDLAAEPVAVALGEHNPLAFLEVQVMKKTLRRS